jgi:hypothetical protein
LWLWPLVRADVYGMAANLAARVASLASPGTAVVSDAVAPLIRDGFELQVRPPAAVKGIEGPIAYHQVLGERADAARVGGRSARLSRISWRSGFVSKPVSSIGPRSSLPT